MTIQHLRFSDEGFPVNGPNWGRRARPYLDRFGEWRTLSPGLHQVNQNPSLEGRDVYVKVLEDGRGIVWPAMRDVVQRTGILVPVAPLRAIRETDPVAFVLDRAVEADPNSLSLYGLVRYVVAL